MEQICSVTYAETQKERGACGLDSELGEIGSVNVGQRLWVLQWAWPESFLSPLSLMDFSHSLAIQVLRSKGIFIYSETPSCKWVSMLYPGGCSVLAFDQGPFCASVKHEACWFIFIINFFKNSGLKTCYPCGVKWIRGLEWPWGDFCFP